MNRLLDPSLTAALYAALELPLNTALALDPDTLSRLAALQGRVIAIEFTGTGLTLHLQPGAEGLRLMGEYGGEPDTVLSGSPAALLRLLNAPPGEGMFTGEVTIRGDVELGRRFQRILQGLDFDWEEHMSRLIGDVAAHQIGNAVRGLLDWGRRSADSLRRDAGEYLQEEVRILPSRVEMEHFTAEVEALRMAADRLEARIRRLRGKLEPDA